MKTPTPYWLHLLHVAGVLKHRFYAEYWKNNQVELISEKPIWISGLTWEQVIIETKLNLYFQFGEGRKC